MNSLGKIFKITTWGESHGIGMGVVIDGCPAGLPLRADEITDYLKKNDRPILEIATERDEPDEVQIFSGVYQEQTLGTPISIFIKNCDVVKNDYNMVKNIFRPGHGDYTYHLKYQAPYISGGGRASGRECITRLAAGYIAEKVIKSKFENFSIETKIISLAAIPIIDKNSLEQGVKKAVEIANSCDSSGGMIKIIVANVPGGIGEPVFDGIDSQIASVLMGIGGVKSVEIGLGRKCADVRGSKYNDDFSIKNKSIGFASNNSGGILSGITNGGELVVTIAVKPTPSIKMLKTGATSDRKLKNIGVRGRHDKNITPRIAPIARAMISLVILDNLMLAGKICKDRLK